MKYIKGLIVLVICISTNALAAETPKKLTPFVENVLTHVILHEFGHAMFREFEIPILGNEEVQADSFATFYTVRHFNQRAYDIVSARAKSWFVEDSENSFQDFSGEHPLDIRRGYQVMCWVYGAEPNALGDSIQWLNFSDRDLADCRDTGADQIDSWNKVLPNRDTVVKSRINVIFGEGPYKKVVKKSRLFEKLAQHFRGYPWPETITLHFDHCSEGASWNRHKRRILICDNHVERFFEQETKLEQVKLVAN